jgi:hypothetical protein
MPTRPIFLSRPTSLPDRFAKEAEKFERFLNGHGFHSVRLGAGSYSTKAPLQAVIDLMKTCNGAIILGYPKQGFSIAGFGCDATVELPTPWNQIEGGLAYTLQKPTLVAAHDGIAGGVFDYGITGEFVFKGDLSAIDWFKAAAFTGVFKDWKKRV